jgi:hypothetical protein
LVDLYQLKKGFPPFLRGNPDHTSAGRLAFAGCGEFLLDFLNGHRIHLLSAHLEHNIEIDLAATDLRIILL